MRYFCLTILILSLVASCNEPAPENKLKNNIPPNFIVFIADDVNFDDFGCTGNPFVETPNIDQLAANGLMFNNFYLTASSCSPSRNSIITGRYPHNTGAPELHQTPPDFMESFPELLKKNGYYTGQSGKFHLGPYATRGFDVIYDKRAETGDGGEEMWIKTISERDPNKPFMMWFASYDAHRDWGPNEFSGTHDPNNITPPFYLDSGFQTKEDLGKYYDEIKRFDHYIGLVVEQLKQQGVYENTMIIVMADNGRPFPHSKTRVNDRGMKSPFIIHWPDKIKKKASSTSLVSAIDIAPTILTLAGISPTLQFQGKSFDPLIENPDQPFRNYVFAEHNWHDYEAHERMVRSKNLMYIRNARPNLPQMGPADAVKSPSNLALRERMENGTLSEIQTDIYKTPRPGEELFDCNNDPLQLVNIASQPDKVNDLQFMRDVLDEWIASTSDNVPDSLTESWYTYEPGYVRTEQHGIRGETPGEALNATKNNNPGPF
ncbi:MAG: sulfatase [Bacteroidota bacterium]